MHNVRYIHILGFRVEVHNFGYAAFYYPSFNGNAEFKVSAKGFRELSHYLRFIKKYTSLGNNNQTIHKA